ncbi:hypothetical protein LRS13_10980 [Svornostia abyssi]|uniref:Uncharacterized protein n=1 Tax=Svornostia abyssi TaxID=2898438 RepID=A0ABY5PMS6_9ACTN|nr:hypothetical protein LRS13_10980 [Parviterribacteraceae bacterium J379]
MSIRSSGPVTSMALRSAGGEDVAHPGQALQDVRPVGAVAQHLAGALVQWRPRGLAGGLVAGDPHRHGAGHDARHRADAADLVVGLARDLPVLDEGDGILGRAGGAFEVERGAQGGAHRRAHRRWRDRRAGVGDAPSGVVLADLAGGDDIDDHGPRGGEAGDRLGEGVVRCMQFGVHWCPARYSGDDPGACDSR